MKVEHINPFIESVNDLFSTMLDCELERGAISFSEQLDANREVLALVGLTGPAQGAVALSFPAETTLAMVSRFTGMEAAEIDDDVLDAVAELANIIAGGAKAKLHDSNPPIKISLPSFIRSDSYTVHYPSETEWLGVPFSSELGPFSLRVTFKFNESRAEESAGGGESA